MSRVSLTRFRPLLPHIALWLGIPCCNVGTEGDNPVVGPADASPCKGEAEYAEYVARPAHPPGLSDRQFGSEYDSVEQQLMARKQMPLGLECLEWEYARGMLRLGASNFVGGCGIDWEGETRLLAPGEIVIELQNPSCDVARCGSCAYDSNAELVLPRADLLAPGADVVHVSLRLRDCKGELAQAYEWEISIAEDRGISCRPLEAWSVLYPKVSNSDVLSETQLNLYAPCAGVEDAVDCTEGRSCNGGYCVPTCTSDADCPLEGALRCRAGACLVGP